MAKFSDKITISGLGCALADRIYNGISFHSPAFQKYLSQKEGDGGLSPGKLVFTEELERFAGLDYGEILHDITGNREADVMNVGGPSLVSLILASQLLNKDEYRVQFYGLAGDDEYSDFIFERLSATPLDIMNYRKLKDGATPTTDVFSDPEYNRGSGERTFVNNIGAAWHFHPEDVPDDFFEAGICCFGGTALVPRIHDSLTSLLRRARSNNCISVVNTVFDFRNQEKYPDRPWPLVDHPEDFGLIDVLIMDGEEALKISGRQTLKEAAEYFLSTAVSSFIITDGANDLYAASRGLLFEKQEIAGYPVSRKISETLKNSPQLKGDTTGCGDNFAGGFISSLAFQLKDRKKGHFNLSEALSWGVCSGGNCCFTVGGTYVEEKPGELHDTIKAFQSDYLDQLGV